MKPTKKKLMFVCILIFVMTVLHFDFWNWDKIHPIVFGWMPIGLFYHVVYCLVFIGVIALMNSWAWPAPDEESIKRKEK